MTISKGQAWGWQGALEAPGRLAASDASLAALVGQAVLAGQPPAPVGLSGGDLYRTLGGDTASRHPSDPDAWHYPIDALVVRTTAGGERRDPRVAVAHVIGFAAPPGGRTRRAATAALRARGSSALVRAPWFVDETLVAANAAFVADWNVAPRGHPNDGRLDATRGALPTRDRRQLAGRLVAGTHVPHPGLATSRTASLEAGPGPWRLFIDGADAGLVDDFDVRVIPDAITVVV
ncbi:MAG: hypothetical protein R2754_05465 [Microthrixaceae bacterium]